MNRKELERAFITYSLKSPCLSNEIDYKNDKQREKFYRREAQLLDLETLKQEVEFFKSLTTKGINPCTK